MSTILGNAPAHPIKSLNQDLYAWIGRVTLGSASIASSSFPDPGITITRNSAGNYALAYPGIPTGKRGMFVFQLLSAAKTVVSVETTAEDLVAGTATIVTLNDAGAETDPATGDILKIGFLGERSSG